MRNKLIIVFLLLFTVAEIFAQSGSRRGSRRASQRASIGTSATTVTITPDTIAPEITAFTIPATAEALTVDISTFTATDNKAVTGYRITETSTAPLPAALGWTGVAPTYFIFTDEGEKTLYAWVKDAAGNVSESATEQVTITLPPPQYAEDYPGTIYYVNNETGSNSNDGLTKENPKKSFIGFNEVLFDGDAVLFESTNEWNEKLEVETSGSIGDTIYFGAYGPVSSKPKFYASEIITGWTKRGSSNIYTAHFTTDINQLFIDGVKMTAARYPNTGYDYIETVNSTSSFTSTELNGSINYTGAKWTGRTDLYSMLTLNVTSSSGQTITLASAPYGGLTATKEGFILTNKLEFLDEAGEWYYNPTTDSVYVWTPTGESPSAMEVRGSTLDYNVTIPGQYVLVQDFELLHAKTAGVYTTGNNVTIKNNTVFGAEQIGIKTYGASACNIVGNSINNSTRYGIENYGTNAIISNNTVKNIFLFDNIGADGVGAWYSGAGIYNEGRGGLIKYNTIDSSGYNGIQFFHNNNVIEYNYIKNVNLTKDDGGGIYTATGSGEHPAGSIIRHNIIDGSFGTFSGFTTYLSTLGEGIYLDEESDSITVYGNTVANCTSGGLYQHKGGWHEWYDNTTFRVKNGLVAKHRGIGSNYHDNLVYGFSLDINARQSERMANITAVVDIPTFADNTYINHYKTADIFYSFQGGVEDTYNLSEWQTYISGDTGSTVDNTALPTGYGERLIYNPTTDTITYKLNYAIGAKNAATGADITTDFTVLPFKSIIITGFNLATISETILNFETEVQAGFTTQYGTNSTSTVRRAMPVTMTEDGLIESVSFYHGGGTGTCLVGVYSDDTTGPDLRLAISEVTTLNVSAGWNTVDLINPLFVETGTKIWIAVTPSIGGLKYEAGEPYRAQAGSGDYTNGLPVDFGPFNLATGKYSIYCTYIK